jgi:homocysteine S-methyltransferase
MRTWTKLLRGAKIRPALTGLRATFGEGPPIFAGGFAGPSGDAYKPADSLDRRAAGEFHRLQIAALASAGVDFLHLATAPNVEEAQGVADAMAETGLSYMISGDPSDRRGARRNAARASG